ncbi:MAG: ABC transporter permease [Bryobacteraceae bacterium]
MLDRFLQDLRFGLSQIWRKPGFAMLSVFALALGIGAASSIYSVVSAVLLHPLPFGDAERLVTLWALDRKHGDQPVEISLNAFRQWRKQNQIFDDIAVYTSVNLDFAFTGNGEPQQVEGVTATDNFFSVMGVKPVLGRTFTGPQDIVISNRLWKTRYGGDPTIIGRGVLLSDEKATISGVMGPDFDYPKDADVWAPLLGDGGLEKNPDIRVLAGIARMKPDIDVRKARAEMNVIADRVERAFPLQNHGLGVLVTPLTEALFGKAKPALLLMLGAVLLVLVIACANVGNLLLARATGRQRELAVRAALGATRARLIQQLLTDSLILAILGGAAGLLVAQFGVAALKSLAAADLPRIQDVHIDAGVVAFAALLTLATVLIAGLVPALEASRFTGFDALKESGTKASASRSRKGMRNALVIGEIAIAFVVLSGAGLLVRSFSRLQSIDPGFRAANVLTFRVTFGTAKYAKQEPRRVFYQALLDRLRSLPGVESAGAILLRPLSGTVGWDNAFTVEGQSVADQALNPAANYEAISPDYFRTMRIPLLAGRDVALTDTAEAPGALMVNESTAKRYWPGQQAVGKRLKLGGPNNKNPWLTVVGVVKDVRYREWESARVDLYIPFYQRSQHRSDFVVKTAVDPLTLVSAVRSAVYALDKDQPLSSITTVDTLVSRTLARPRFNMLVFSWFAAVAVLLGVIGIYGVLAYSVAQQSHEIGIRMALGSSPGRILRQMLAEGLRLAVTGTALGIVLSLATTRLMSALLFTISAHDPWTFATVSIGVLAVCVLACVVPAVRAADVDPMRALQQE